MKDVSCVNQLSFVQNVTIVPIAAPDLPVGARLHQFWETWEAPGAGSKVIRIPKKGYTLPFRIRPNLTRSPTIISGRHPLRTSSQEQLPDRGITCTYAKECSRTGQSSEISRFLQPAFLGIKTQQQVETYFGP